MPGLSKHPLGQAPSVPTGVQHWLRRRRGKRLWLGFTGAFTTFLVSGVALTIAGYDVGLMMIFLAILIGLIGFAGAFLLINYTLLHMLIATLVGTRVHKASRLDGIRDDLAPIAKQLEQLRFELSARRRSAAILGFAIGAVFAAMLIWDMWTSPNPVYPFMPFLGLFLPLVGAMIAVTPVEAGFGKSFKAGVLPAMLARFGPLQSLPSGAQPDFAAAQRAGVMWRYHRLTVSDGISGNYRNYPLQIHALSLWRGDAVFKENSDDGKTVSRLALRLELERSIRATTAVTDRARFLEDVSSKDERLRPVRLEYPLFEEVFATRSSDEVGARALLTPAVMQRLLHVADNTGFSPPALLVDGTCLLVVMQSFTHAYLLEPISVATDLNQHLSRLDSRLKTIFGVVDVMIDMAEAVVGPRHQPAESDRVTQ